MATYNKFNIFVQDLTQKVHNLASDAVKVLLTNTLPVATNAVYTDVSGGELSTANGYTVGGGAPSITSDVQTSGTLKYILGNFVWTASGGSFGPFRYAILYNPIPVSPAKPLIAWWDYGSSITVLNGETFTWSPDATNGVFTLT